MEFKMPTFTTLHIPKDTPAPSPEEALPTTDESLSISVRKGNEPDETEI